MPQPLVISYYTPDTPYEQHAVNLRKCVDKLGLEARIEPRQRKGSWLENCAQKALFVREMRQEIRRPVLWLDADAIVNKPIPQFNCIDVDFSALRRWGWSFSGGQIYFGSGPMADRLVNLWCDYCTTYPFVWDQVSLGYAWWDATLEGPLTSLWLPTETYEKEASTRWGRLRQRYWTRPPLIHRQESRQTVRQEAARHPNEFRNKQIPKWWRDAAAADRPFSLEIAQRRELGLI